MSAHTLKELQVRKSKLQEEFNRLETERDDLTQSCNVVAAKLAEVATKIKKIESKPTVSEHALLRYVEHVYGIDFKEVENIILTEQNIELIKTLGSGRYPLKNGLKAVVKGMTVVTVMEK